MRHEPTDAERVLWQHLRHLTVSGSHFRRQATIGPYFVDFACHAARLVIELDGGQHNEAAGLARDAKRTADLETRGYRVLRLDIADNLESDSAIPAPTANSSNFMAVYCPKRDATYLVPVSMPDAVRIDAIQEQLSELLLAGAE